MYLSDPGRHTGRFCDRHGAFGGFAILLIMAWFDAFAHIGPRGIIVLSGCSIVVTALGSWFFVQCDDALASVLTSLLPMLSFVLLPLASAKRRRAGKGRRRRGLAR